MMDAPERTEPPPTNLVLITALQDALAAEQKECRKLRKSIAALEQESARLREAVERTREAISWDAYAATFQTMGQYRSALLQVINHALAGEGK